MKRRIAIRNLVLMSAGAAVLDACGSKEALAYKNIPLTGSEQEFLSQLCEFIIPTTPDFIGAKDLHADEFAVMMIDDCESPENQAIFLDGLKKFEEACKAKTGSTFMDGTHEQRATFLSALEAKESDQPENVVRFYKGVKWFTIQSFTSSEQYLTQVRNYSLIPPKFEACVPVQAV